MIEKICLLHGFIESLYPVIPEKQLSIFLKTVIESIVTDFYHLKAIAKILFLCVRLKLIADINQ